MTSKSATALRHSLGKHDSTSVALEKIAGVVELDSTVKPMDAASTLWDSNILGAPVWDVNEKKYTGVFDIRDILSAVIMTTRHIHSEDSPGPYNTVFADKVGKYTIKYLSSRNPIHVCPPSTTLVEMCEIFASSRCRQLAISKNEGERCENLISRSSIAKFMSDHTSSDDLSETVEDCGIDYLKEVFSVPDNVSAFKAFELMDSKGLYGVAVVDRDDGSLIGYTSAKDVWLAAVDSSKTSMELEILSYLGAVRQMKVEKDGKTRHPACHVHANDTLLHVLHVLVKTKYHRVFVVNKERRPIGVISITDILKFALNKSEK